MLSCGATQHRKLPYARVSRTFVLVWLAYWMAVLAFPGSPSGGSALVGALIQGAFVATVLFTMRCFQPAPNASQRIVSSRAYDAGVGRAAWVGLVLGAIGTALLLYDRTAIQGVDFGGGLAAARNSWLSASEGRPGASSAFSVLGYVFGGCHFVSAALVILRINGRLSMCQSFVLLACAVLVWASSAMNGGRSSLLLFPAVCLSALWLNPRVSLRGLLLSPQLLVCVGVAVAYSLFIFASRAALVGDGNRDYTLKFLEFLSIDPSPWICSGDFPDVFWISILAWAYLTHSFATTCLIAIEPTAQSLIVGSNPILMLSKVGLASAPANDWFLSGRFPGLPGALYHQFGAMGLAIGGVLLGASVWAALEALARFPRSLVALGAFLLTGATLVLSPELLAFDFLACPSVAVGFLILAPFEKATGPSPGSGRISAVYSHARP